MDRAQVRAWVAGYEAAWRSGDLAALDELFTPDVGYSREPFRDPDVGLDAVKAFWREDDGLEFTVEHDVVAVDGPTAVVRLEVRYGDPAAQTFRDLWVLHFADDGRVDRYEEWPFAPSE